jgi:hypothetical protein
LATPDTGIKVLDELGHRISVGPGDPKTSDVLYYAQLLIEVEGWNDRKTTSTSSTADGWTLHDAIGEACTRLSADRPGGRGSKDAPYTTVSGNSATLRSAAQAAVDAELQRMLDSGEWKPSQDPMQTSGRLDYSFNDEASSKDEVLAVLTRAREAS